MKKSITRFHTTYVRMLFRSSEHHVCFFHCRRSKLVVPAKQLHFVHSFDTFWFEVNGNVPLGSFIITRKKRTNLRSLIFHHHQYHLTPFRDQSSTARTMNCSDWLHDLANLQKSESRETFLLVPALHQHLEIYRNSTKESINWSHQYRETYRNNALVCSMVDRESLSLKNTSIVWFFSAAYLGSN